MMIFDPSENVSLEEQVVSYKKYNEALRSEVRQLRHDLAMLSKENKRLRNDFARLERLLQRSKQRRAS